MYLCSLIGGDFDEAIGIIEGTGSGEFDGDYFVGTSSVANLADDTGSLIAADPRARLVFIAWKAEGKKIVVIERRRCASRRNGGSAHRRSGHRRGARLLVRRHSPSKDGRLSTPYRTPSPASGRRGVDATLPLLPRGLAKELLRKRTALGTRLAPSRFCACRRS
jgi:hypothetical protein